MDLSTQKTNHASSREIDNRMISPPGWITTTLKNKNLKTEVPSTQEEGKMVPDQYLSAAAARAEELIDALNNELAIPVPVSYMRVETGALFHVLLLTDIDSFLSPKIQAARLLADKYSKTDGSYDIRFSFAVESENLVNTHSKFSEYKLMHIRNTQNTQGQSA